ncbi:Putative virulence factor [Kosakonia arachidis]|uniref:Putative virulence factor n=2 Tax=Kosakonia arachidis TaxID=551989 RepID=A0A1I7E8R7_9ENTR|nr:Putative virulence factor [Kosakonia arachidis]
MQLRILYAQLINFSYRYDLSAVRWNRLNQTETCHGPDTASTKAAISEFIAWLGYANMAVEERPRSRINPQTAIFMPLRRVNVTTRFIHQKLQSVGQATHWAYDWLIALDNRMREQNKVDNAYGLSHQ